jgi:hypothetical protein
MAVARPVLRSYRDPEPASVSRARNLAIRSDRARRRTSCWCDAPPPIYLYDGFPVIYWPATRGECDVVSVAFRIEGVPGDPALERRFEMAQAGSVTGDPLGDGAIVQGLVYERIIGFIRLSVTAPLAPQVWSVQRCSTQGALAILALELFHPSALNVCVARWLLPARRAAKRFPVPWGPLAKGTYC